MLALTLAQMRRSIPRLLAAGIAIVIGTAFVAATLVTSNVIERAAVDGLTASYGRSDLIVSGLVTPDHLTAIEQVDGVATAHGVTRSVIAFPEPHGMSYIGTSPAPPDDRLLGMELSQGSTPTDGQIALPVDVAERLGYAVGDEVDIVRFEWETTAPEGDAMLAEEIQIQQQLTLAGLLHDPSGVFGVIGGMALLGPGDAASWYDAGLIDGEEPFVDYVQVLVEAEADPAEVGARVTAALDGDVVVRTRAEQAASAAEELTGEANIIAVIGIGFASIALIVAGLVISNTFLVLVAQRTRALALLRCVGATARQLRRSVVLEASLLGLVASLVGATGGVGLAQLVLTVLRQTTTGGGLPAFVLVDPLVILLPVGAGVLVAVVASLAPARAASRVAPLAALRPEPAPLVTERAGRMRLAFAGLLGVGGVAGLGLGLLIAEAGDLELGLLAGIVGGFLSFVAVLMTAVYWIPAIISTVGSRALRTASPAAKLALANTLRHPRRTAATSSALLIGITLVAMMSTGASTARASFDSEFDVRYPVDIIVASARAAMTEPVSTGSEGISASQVDALAAIDGVGAAVAVGIAPITVADASASGITIDLDALVVDVAAADALHDPGLMDALEAGTVVLPGEIAMGSGLDSSSLVTVDSQVPVVSASDDRPQPIRMMELGGAAAVVAAPRDVAEPAPSLPVGAVWLQLHDDATTSDVIRAAQDLVAADGAVVRAPVAERDGFDRLATSLLAVVVGLLAVAVVIALVGVANTLSLSVIERRHESAMLRAIGLTRRQLRVSLAIESVIIAGAGAMLGTGLGMVYGYIGARTMLGPMADGVPFAVPWWQLAAAIVVSVVAGIAASILPARRAARTPPVAALARP